MIGVDNNINLRNVLCVLKNWIMSWFKVLETKAELKVSQRFFRLYLEKKLSLEI